MERQCIDTRLGPVDVRVYRLGDGWWPVAVGGVGELFAYQARDGQPLPETVDAAVRCMQRAIDGLTSTDAGPAVTAPAVERLPSYD